MWNCEAGTVCYDRIGSVESSRGLAGTFGIGELSSDEFSLGQQGQASQVESGFV